MLLKSKKWNSLLAPKPNKRIPDSPTNTDPSTPNSSTTDPSALQRQLVAASTPSKNPSASFLGLPLELRDRIYHEVWRKKKAFHLTYGRIRFAVIYEDPDLHNCSCIPCIRSGRMFIVDLNRDRDEDEETRIPRLAWFMANKQILAEAIEQFYHGRSSLWIFDLEFNNTSVPESPSEHLLLTPWKTTTIAFGNIHLKDHYDTPRKGMSYMTFSGQPFIHLNPKSITNPSLRCLKMAFIPDLSNKGPADRPLTVDFGPLERLKIPSLQEVDIKIKIMDSYSEHVEAMEKLKEQVLELGMGLVGREGKVKFMPREDLWPDLMELFKEREWPDPPPWWYWRFSRG